MTGQKEREAFSKREGRVRFLLQEEKKKGNWVGSASQWGLKREKGLSWGWGPSVIGMGRETWRG